MSAVLRLLLAVALIAFPVQGPGAHQGFVRVDTSSLALTHARVIHGTGRSGQDNQTITIRDGHIQAIGPSATMPVPPNATVIDLAGRTVIPGLVGMHEHLFYEMSRPSMGSLIVAPQAALAKLYLAAGVTTIRTAGTVATFRGISALNSS